jgi:3-deoxy-manno-octulosonate cytidylyltransferase (CMP-KDO synthetase)
MSTQQSILGVIPARLKSTRLPGKVLKLIGDKPVVVWVYEASKRSKALTDVVVAVDSEQVLDVCNQFSVPAIMTSPEHRCGSDRLNEVMGKRPADIYVNIQGDEPTLQPEHLDLLLSPFFDRPDETFVSTLMVEIDEVAAADPNNVKVVVDDSCRALYFSRYAIPYNRDRLSGVTYHKHIGLYAYRRSALENFHTWAPSELELAESLEQLRFLQNGVPIHVMKTDINTVGVDTEADLELARNVLSAVVWASPPVSEV